MPRLCTAKAGGSAARLRLSGSDLRLAVFHGEEVLFRLRIEQVHKLRIEREVRRAACADIVEAEAGRRDDGDDIVAGDGHMQVHLAAHHLGHVHLARQRMCAGAGLKRDVLGTDADDDLLPFRLGGSELLLDLVGQRHDGARHACSA